MFLVGLCGKAGAGKTTAAQILVEHYGFVRKSFAAPLKNAVSILFGWHIANLDDPDFKSKVDPKWGISPRKAMQLLATDLIRDKVSRDFWVMHMEDELPRYSEDTMIVIDDVRFQNEIAFIHTHGGIVIEISSDENENDEDAHKSENQSLTRIDGFIDNDYDLSELERAVISEILDFCKLDRGTAS